MSVPPLERVAGEQGKESLSFPNAELGAKLLNINGRYISVLPTATAKSIGETFLGVSVGPSGWPNKGEDDAHWYTTPDYIFDVRVSTSSFGSRSFRVVPTDKVPSQMRVEHLVVGETIKDEQWEEVDSGYFGRPSIYWPERLGESVPTVTIYQIMRVSKGKEVQHYLFEATFASIPNKYNHLQNCNVSSSYQPIEEPVAL